MDARLGSYPASKGFSVFRVLAVGRIVRMCSRFGWPAPPGHPFALIAPDDLRWLDVLRSDVMPAVPAHFGIGAN